MTKRPVRLGTLLILTAMLAACSQQDSGASSSAGAGGARGGGARGPVEVAVETLKTQDVPRTTELAGRVAAKATAEIRPQVDGIVRKIVFEEGRPVHEGDVLYQLDDRAFQAALSAAKAAVSKAGASTAAAQSTFDRVQTLVQSKAASASALDDARSTLLQAQASEEAAKAELQAAQINLDNTTIKAPIDGIIGTSVVSVGSLVTANQSAAMATIRQIDPIYVDLVETSVNLLRLRGQIHAGEIGRPTFEQTKVHLTLENGQQYHVEGRLSLAEPVVSESTGTFSLRAVFANPHRLLLPGMFVRATVEVGTMKNALLVPQRAVSRDASGEATAYVVSADGKAEKRILTTAGSTNNDWIVTAGVAAGDQLILDGFQKFSDGSAVKALEASVDEDGVVAQDLTAAPNKTDGAPKAPASAKPANDGNGEGAAK
ncbi:efflux RND transporter periplasmic adaptor subunit [Consotaella salsifontis]|uniref:Membrane fusion protein, multidrug efflux system n=1 Tax=Consotaella salsifontis TaxID=1365950 RepID=A0A1T4L3D5_9HYPH|nr:efflux RND transporter periplasmic adaptor subunit [Consotaella salsifontis]SJZ49098.1 membrane fusion protein, multidrug efflux system [Consotaella salsifontis]